MQATQRCTNAHLIHCNLQLSQGLGVVCRCFAIRHPEHARERALPPTTAPSPTSYSLTSVTFPFLSAAVGLHGEEGRSRYRAVPNPSPAKSKLTRKDFNNKRESEKAVRSAAKIRAPSPKRPSLRKPASQTRSRGCFPRVNRVLIDTAYVCSMRPSARLSRTDRITQTHSL